MNDFTKEELQELYCMMTGQPGSLSFEDEDISILASKIQSMIDGHEVECIKNVTNEEFKEMYPPIDKDE